MILEVIKEFYFNLHRVLHVYVTNCDFILNTMLLVFLHISYGICFSVFIMIYRLEIILTALYSYSLICKVIKYLFPDNTDARIINQIHCIHNKLSALCSYINWLYGFQILSIVGSAFNITINEFYYCYDVSKITEDDKVLDIYFSIQWGVLQQIEIFVIVMFCNKTSNEVNIHSCIFTTDIKTCNISRDVANTNQ